MAAGKNRFNRLSSKEWLPFQKSWFRYGGEEELLKSYLRFFTLKEESEAPVYYRGAFSEMAAALTSELGFSCTDLTDCQSIQFAFIDLREVSATAEAAQWQKALDETDSLVRVLKEVLLQRRFVAIAVGNFLHEASFEPRAWQLATRIGAVLTLKDEKICGLQRTLSHDSDFYNPSGGHFYMLHFRLDELSGLQGTTPLPFRGPNRHSICKLRKEHVPPSWFILKPQRRKKNEIVHPAKYPEELAAFFIQVFTRRGDNVFDPMSGTGSTQVAALKLGRNAYGTELSSFFTDIARERCLSLLFENAMSIGAEQEQAAPNVDIVCGDARNANSLGFPKQDLIMTSPPYWDMLNMKGAENQAKRKLQGLPTKYSDDTMDLGNIPSYGQFVNELAEIYRDMSEMLHPGGHLVVVVKNIKKQGRNYPFAWDLASLLQKHYILLPEVFWCQDDLSIAPYGYGNTFVSNTFHQYCLVFQKPL